MKVPDLPGTEDAPFDFSLAHTIADTAPNPCLCLHLVHPSLFVGHESGTICCYNVETFEAGPQLQGHTGAVTCFTGDLKRGYLASGSQDHTVRLWDPVTGALLDIFTGVGPAGGAAACLGHYHDHRSCPGRWSL